MPTLPSRSLRTLAQRIAEARKKLSMTPKSLARPYFSRRLIYSLEGRSHCPSRLVLHVFVTRLGLQGEEATSLLASAMAEIAALPLEKRYAVDEEAVVEDIDYQLSYAKMLARESRIDEALSVIAGAESYLSLFAGSRCERASFGIAFARARLSVQIGELTAAQHHLEGALELGIRGYEGVARAHNMLGAIYYAKEEPDSALRHHLAALSAMHEAQIKDLNLHVSIYQNLANDYWALDIPKLAVTSYREALGIVPNLSDPNREGELLWGLAAAYRSLGDWNQTALSTVRAMHSFIQAGNARAEASARIDLAEAFLAQGRRDEAKESLDKAGKILKVEEHPGLSSLLYRYYAELALMDSQLETAEGYAKTSVQFSAALLDSPERSVNTPWVDPKRTHAEGLAVAALIKERRGFQAEADKLFEQALRYVNSTSQKESIRTIYSRYATVLRARGAHEQSVRVFQSLTRAASA